MSRKQNVKLTATCVECNTLTLWRANVTPLACINRIDFTYLIIWRWL